MLHRWAIGIMFAGAIVASSEAAEPPRPGNLVAVSLRDGRIVTGVLLPSATEDRLRLSIHAPGITLESSFSRSAVVDVTLISPQAPGSPHRNDKPIRRSSFFPNAPGNVNGVRPERNGASPAFPPRSQHS